MVPGSVREPSPFFRNCGHDPVVIPSQTTPEPSRVETRADHDLRGAGRDGLDADRFFRDGDLEELARKTYDPLGLDLRVLANVRPDAYWMNTMLHEFGHAVYDRHVNPRLPYFVRTVAHTCTTEAIALTMGSLAEDPGCLLEQPGSRSISWTAIRSLAGEAP
jgi:hypothetical protein